ncbi:MAG: amidophosphoribosyltransferase [Oscillospiraceae bacterium]|nr:amidophosphoribosyltransferase [Candidatus Equicaccousia limihippi]
MGGFFGIISDRDCLQDVFFGVDYHSHLGTRCGGLAAYNKEVGLQRKIHHINNAPFRTKFERIFDEMSGSSAIGCISDSDPQPMLIRSHHGTYAICMVGVINNSEQLIDNYLSSAGCHFDSMTGGKINSTELLAALIDQKETFAQGIRFAQECIEGSANILILKDDGNIIAARDRYGRLPVQIGKNDNGYAVTFEPFAYQKLGYEDCMTLGPAQAVEISQSGITEICPAQKKKRICSFLWSYYGYPTSSYEGVSVEAMRYRNGELLANLDYDKNLFNLLDYVAGVPDSGTPHAIGYSNKSGVRYARAFIKYTPTWQRSFMPVNQSDRNKIAKMKLISVKEFIKDKELLIVDDSIVRGTQLKETVDFLYENGAKAVHMRSACPPIMYGCKYLNFSRATSDMELIARRVIDELEGEEGLKHIDEYSDASTERGKKLRENICNKFHFASLDFQSLENVVKAIGLDPSELCTYCWNGKE